MFKQNTLKSKALWFITIATFFFSAIPQGRASDLPLLTENLPVAAQQPGCPGNLIQNGDFTAGMQYWSAAFATPQLNNSAGCGNPNFIMMWGNQVVGEAIQQTLSAPLVAGQKYSFSACVKWISQPTPLPPYVRFKVRFSNGSLPSYTTTGAVVGVIGQSPSTPMIPAPGINTVNWVTVTLQDWTATGNYDTITINPENASSVNSGGQVSWGGIDNVCLKRVPSPCMGIKLKSSCCMGTMGHSYLYAFSFTVNNPFSYPCNVTITSPDGNIIAFGPTTLPPGNSVISVIFQDVFPFSNPFCFFFNCSGGGATCQTKYCFDHPPC